MLSVIKCAVSSVLKSHGFCWKGGSFLHVFLWVKSCTYICTCCPVRVKTGIVSVETFVASIWIHFVKHFWDAHGFLLLVLIFSLWQYFIVLVILNQKWAAGFYLFFSKWLCPSWRTNFQSWSCCSFKAWSSSESLSIEWTPLLAPPFLFSFFFTSCTATGTLSPKVIADRGE